MSVYLSRTVELESLQIRFLWILVHSAWWLTAV